MLVHLLGCDAVGDVDGVERRIPAGCMIWDDRARSAVDERFSAHLANVIGDAGFDGAAKRTAATEQRNDLADRAEEPAQHLRAVLKGAGVSVSPHSLNRRHRRQP